MPPKQKARKNQPKRRKVKHEQEKDFAFFFSAVKELCLKITGQEMNHNTLIADNAGAINNGFSKVFDLSFARLKFFLTCHEIVLQYGR